MTGTLAWLADAAATIGLAALLCGGGTWLTLRLIAGAAEASARSARRLLWVILAGLAFTTTAWTVFRLLLTAWFPRILPAVPTASAGRSLLVLVAGGLIAAATIAHGRRSVRNVTFAASSLCAALSCMGFISLSGVVEPAVLAYDLLEVLYAMLAASLLCAFALWWNGRPANDGAGGTATGRARAAALMTAAIMALILATLAAILPFQDWQTATAEPGNRESRPLAVVIGSELMASLLFALAGAGVDRQSAARGARETERLRQLWDSTFEGLLIHRDGIVLAANAAFSRLAASPAADVVGQPVGRFVGFAGAAADERAPVADEPHQQPAHDSLGDAIVQRSDGTTLPVEILRRVIAYDDRMAEIIALRDIGERRAAEARIRFLAHHDVLTGLANRILLHDIAANELASARGQGGEFVVMCLDLDRFKAVNDTFGHHVGDLLLKQVANRIEKGIRIGDHAARVGGDEFILLLREDRGAPGGLLEGAGALATRLIENLSAPYEIEGQIIVIGASAGMSVYPRDGTQIQSLINNADLALYHSKVSGRGTFSFYHTDMDTRQRERRILEQDLSAAIAAGELTLVFQPLFAADAATVVGFEALSRWVHPVHGNIPPADFIALAEDSDLIVRLGRWVLETGCRAAASWHPACRIAVNVSPRQFRSGELPALVAEVLARTGLRADRLELEITEGIFIDNTRQALAELTALRALGVRIALDDFGTGFSSLSYLRQFPFDTIKIDRSFIERITGDAATQAIVSAIVALSHRLGLCVTAEGVETRAQLDQLRLERCDFIQGYLLGRPMPAGEVPAFLSARSDDDAVRSDDPGKAAHHILQQA